MVVGRFNLSWFMCLWSLLFIGPVGGEASYPSVHLFLVRLPSSPMSDLSPRSPLSNQASSNGSSNSQINLPSAHDATHPSDPTHLAGSGCYNPGQPLTPHLSSYAHVVILGVGGNPHPQLPFLNLGPSDQSLGAHPPLAQPVDPVAQNPSPPPSAIVQELSACCLLSKVWGEVLTLAAIINKTKKD